MSFGAKARHRIVIERKIVARNSIKEEIVTWAPVCSVRASVIPLRGREFFAAGGMQQESITKFLIRFREGIQESMRVIWRDEIYNIGSAIDVEGGRRSIELMTTKGIADE